MSEKKFTVFVGTDEIMQDDLSFLVMVGNIKISKSRSGKQSTVHITTGRADSFEGGDFKVSELEIAIQDFFDKNF